MAELADHIDATHHAFVHDAHDRLGHTVPRVNSDHAAGHWELHELGWTLEAFTEEMHDHTVRAERVVSPWLRPFERRSEIQTYPPWSVRRPISCMVHDHNDAATALDAMRRLTNDYTPPDDARLTCPPEPDPDRVFVSGLDQGGSGHGRQETALG